MWFFKINFADKLDVLKESVTDSVTLGWISELWGDDVSKDHRVFILILKLKEIQPCATLGSTHPDAERHISESLNHKI